MKRRRRRSRVEWEELIGEQESSGLSARKFCLQKSLGPASFYRWRRRLRGDNHPNPERHEENEQESFIDLGRLDSVSEAVSGGQLKDKALLPSNRLTKALNYVHKRKNALKLFLLDPEIPIDTNELERALGVIPLGRKNWLFCWTEVGAKYVGIFQSLIVTCKMQGVDPYTYLVDVLQRVADHPQSEIEQLTPRLWKRHFADSPLRSDLDLIPQSQ